MEAAFLAWIAAHRAPWLDALMLAVTIAGRGGVVWVAAAIGRALVRRRLAMAACQAVIAVTLAWVIPAVVLKPYAARPRPFVASPALQAVAHERPSSYSFPSGHAASAVAGASTVGVMWPAARVAGWALAALIVCSRAYLGVHYPTDLIVGAALGWLVARLVVGGTRWRGAPAP